MSVLMKPPPPWLVGPSALTVPTFTPPVFASAFPKSESATARVSGVVSKLLDFVRRGERRAAPVDLAEVIESVLPIVRPKARGRADQYGVAFAGADYARAVALRERFSDFQWPE